MDWQELEARVDEFGFRRFYDTFNAIGVETFNENANENANANLTSKDSENSTRSTVDDKLKSKMLEDL
jgi:hypothetical protein